jgi:hypothetical protein
MMHREPEPMHLDDPRICRVYSGTSYTILKCKEDFTNITPSNRNMTIIMGSKYIKEGHRPAIITLPQGIITLIKSAIYAPNATRNLISFNNIREYRYHIHTNKKKDQKVLLVVLNTPNGIEIKEIMFAYSLGFYITKLQTFHMDVHTRTLFETWHNRLRDLGTNMFHRIMKATQGIPYRKHTSTL